MKPTNLSLATAEVLQLTAFDSEHGHGIESSACGGWVPRAAVVTPVRLAVLAVRSRCRPAPTLSGARTRPNPMIQPDNAKVPSNLIGAQASELEPDNRL